MSGQPSLVTLALDAEVKRPDGVMIQRQFYRDKSPQGSGVYKAMDENGNIEIVGGPGGGFIDGGGTANFITKFTPDGNTIGDSSLFDDGNIGYGTVTPNTVAAFDIVSTTKGMLFPRMTTVQRDAIVVGATEDGLFIFNTTTEKFNFWNDTLGAWESIDTATGGDVSGAGTTNFIPRWTDGPNSVLGNSIIRDNGTVAAVNRAVIATSMFAIQGADAAAVNYSLDVYNSTPTRTFGVRNDGFIYAGDIVNGNMTIGAGSGFNSTLISNTFIGTNVAPVVAAGAANNIGIGNMALFSLTVGDENIAIGTSSLQNVTIANGNTAVGHRTLISCTASQNTAFGDEALFANSTGTFNVGVGYLASNGITSGSQNTVVGAVGLPGVTTGSRNTAIGYNTFGIATAVRSGCIALGNEAGFRETGSDKLYISNQTYGSEALDRSSSMIYGMFNANPLLQGLVLNAVIYLKDTAAPFNYWSVVNTGGVITTSDTGSPLAPF